jgi:hypothetical protein
VVWITHGDEGLFDNVGRFRKAGVDITECPFLGKLAADWLAAFPDRVNG